MPYPAHIIKNSSGEKIIQTVAEHCENCARLCDEQLEGIKLKKTAFLCGLLHDLGKSTNAFKSYIERSSEGLPVVRGSVNHTFAGVRFAFQRWHQIPVSNKETAIRNLTCETIAYAAGGHHGLFDCFDSESKNGFQYRIEKEDIGYEEAVNNYLSDCKIDLDASFEASVAEISEVMDNIKRLAIYPNTKEANRRQYYYLAMLSRLLLSTVINSDRLDTASFMHGVERKQTPLPKDFWRSLLHKMEENLPKPVHSTPLTKARQEFSEQCVQAATKSGIYRLSIPTGGGKTLSSLRYALAAAHAQNKKRILFVVPLLSVLEQNAAVIRNAVDCDGAIVEHHSNIPKQQEPDDSLHENELLQETWDAPIIITTLVQLLNTLFAGQTTAIRRMQALVDSIIIFDEIQSLPRHMLSQFNMAINFLSHVCGANVILCSATQPCLEETTHPILVEAQPELIPYVPAQWDIFKRTTIEDKRKKNGYTPMELADFMLEKLTRCNNLLLVCNTKAQAAAVYQAFGTPPDTIVVHLSTSMCMAHRIRVLAQIRDCLANNTKKLVCVSTQLIEAGVDISFGCVVRMLAGMDSIVQAAGRCNRNGESTVLGEVSIVNYHGENLTSLPEIRQAQIATEGLLVSYEQQPDIYADDIASNESVRFYYKKLYADMPANAQDYPLPAYNSTMIKLLSQNSDFVSKNNNYQHLMLNQAFKTAGKEFCVFEDQTVDVIVPYGKGADVIEELCSEKAKWDFAYQKKLFSMAKPYTVSLFEHQVKQLQKAGELYPVCDKTALALASSSYSDTLGVIMTGQLEKAFMEV